LFFKSDVRAPQVLNEPGEERALRLPDEDDAGGRTAFLAGHI